MKNLFSPSESFNNMSQPTPYKAPIQPDENINAEVEQPEQGALSRIYSLLGKMPQRQEPGKLSKIGGALMAFGGRSPEQIDQVINRPYYRDMEDFNSQIDPLLKAGKLESDTLNNQSLNNYRMGNVNNASTRAATGQTNATTSQGRVAELTRHNREVESLTRMKQEHPDLRFDTKGPTVLIMDPRTGEIKDSGIETGGMSEEDKLSITQRNALERIGATGAVNKEIKETVPGGSPTNKPMAPTQAKQQLLNNVQQLQISNPELGKFVHTDDDTGRIVIDEPGENWLGQITGPTREQYIKIQQMLTGVSNNMPPAPPPGSVPMTGGDHTVNQTPVGGNPPPPQPKIKMQRADGTIRMVSPEHVQIATQQGFKQVQ